MKALLLTEYRKLRLVDIERPEIAAGDVLVRVAACGICGSDIHGFDGSSGRRIPPLVMGHEAAGTVAEVGPSVSSIRVGDRVTFDSTVYCGRCDECKAGRVNLCPNRRVLGVSCGDYRQNGAFAEFVAVPQHIIHALPPELPFETAAFVEPVSIALHAVNRLNILRGERAVVVGAGMIGLLVVQALRVAGCGEISAIDIDESRLELALKLGAKTPKSADNADVAVEAVGNAAALSVAINSVRRGGRVSLVGNLAPEVPFPLQAVVTRELSLLGSCASAGEYPRAIELLASGEINIKPLLSAVASLSDGANWFDRLYARERGLMKVILQP